MQTLMLGAGATGGYYGGRLIEGGADITFLVRQGRAAMLKEHGLSVKSQYGDMHLKDVKFIEKVDHPYELVILSCKAYDLDAAIESVRPAVGLKTTLIPLLNGMRHLEQLKAAFGAEHVLGGMCIISSTLNDDGSITHFNETHALKFGELSGEITARVKAIRAMMERTKIDWKASEHIERDMWEKWVMLSSLAGITCLMRGSVGEVACSPYGLEFSTGLYDECLSVFKAYGFEARPEFVEPTRKRYVDPKSELKASMLRDLQRGGRVESDHILGDLIARAEAKRLSVPILKTCYLHLKVYEAQRQS